MMDLGVVVPWQSLRRVHEALLEIYPSAEKSLRRWRSGESSISILSPHEMLCGIGFDRIIVAVPRTMSDSQAMEISRWVEEVLSLRLHRDGVMEILDLGENDDVVLWIQQAILRMRRNQMQAEVLPQLQKEVEFLGDQEVRFTRRDWQNARAMGRSFEEFFWAALLENRFVPR